MEIINWLCTPEGVLTMNYGPKGFCWDYDENGKTYFTEFGLTCNTDRTTMMPEEWGGSTFNDGAFQINNTTFSLTDVNPESGEQYDKEYWASYQSPEGLNEADKDWREFTGCTTVEEYMENTDYRVMIATTYSESSKSAELDVVWNQVAEAIVNYSWQAIYAESDEEFDSIVKEMRGRVRAYDPQEQCRAWCEGEAATINELQTPLRGN